MVSCHTHWKTRGGRDDSELKEVLVLGAGYSAPYLIYKLLEMSEELDLFVTVGDIDEELARKRVGNHPRGEAIRFDVNDSAQRASQIGRANVVVNLLSPVYQGVIAATCVRLGSPMISVSYQDQALLDLATDAQRQGVLLLCELGLDPGIDHMAAMRLISDIRKSGGKITSYVSYGSGLPAPEGNHNPLRYAVTWNPRNVVMSGKGGTQHMENGQIKMLAHHHVFDHTWSTDVDGVGTLEAYPNSDSLRYIHEFGLEDVHTMIRGTLRYPGWSETWSQIVGLGLPNELLRIPDLEHRTYREVIEMFLPPNVAGASTEKRVASFLRISPTGRIMDNLRWLGLFSDEPTGCMGGTSAAMMVKLLSEKLRLEEGQRDMVVLVHELDVEYPDGRKERVLATLVERGDPGGFTAMAKTVGLPAALAVKLLLTGEVALTGFHIPTHPSVYVPIMNEIEKEGIVFRERHETINVE